MGKKGNGFIDRTGEVRVMKNGHTAVVKCYRKAIDIDVYFPELGLTRVNMHYNAFKSGSISPWEHLKGDDHTGESAIMKCGLKAIIVAYRRCDDIDVEFPELGELRTGVEYKQFLRKTIAPNAPVVVDRVGERRVMNCGHEAVIACYRKSDDIDVEFPELGIVRTGVRYSNFVKKRISPTVPEKSGSHIGETRYQKTLDMDATIIGWRNRSDIDVEFKDGNVQEHTKYDKFKAGNVCLDGQDSREMLLNARRREKIGQKNTMHCGLECEIVEYNNAFDLTVRFSDGEVVSGKTYDSFVSGSIGHPTVKAKAQIDEKKKMRGCILANK